MIAEAQEGARVSRKRAKLPDVPARRCGCCGARSTVQWRSGPSEVPILCNACGVKYRKGKLQLRGVPDRTLTVDDLENGADLNMLQLDQVSGNSNSSMSPRFRFHPSRPHSKDGCSKFGASLSARDWPFGSTPTAPQGLPGPMPADPVEALWGFMPSVMPTQSRSVPLPPRFPQLYPSMGSFMPMLSVLPIAHSPNAGSHQSKSQGVSAGHDAWRSHPARGLGQKSLDGPEGPLSGGLVIQLNQLGQLSQLEELEKSGSHRVAQLTEPIESEAMVSPRSSDSGMWAKGDKAGLGEAGLTLRWLAKRRRTGPKAG
ncbi:unnamed protein product [Ostreobium quekettii]|uniref:GATA-type domain-containing protein n=1 Tax=Ostreobium quekettii TaxID=121088 RepID=A0A8S1J7X2_9CHLO|nr:unnamed protein product [Ostreobium quekettii]